MDVAARWSSGRVLASSVLTFLCLLLTFSHGSERPSFSFHDKRNTRLILRQDNASFTITHLPMFASPTVPITLVNTSSGAPSFTRHLLPPPLPSNVSISSNISTSSPPLPVYSTISQATSTHLSQSSYSSYSSNTKVTAAAIFPTTAPTTTPEVTSVFSSNLVPTTTVDTPTTQPSETVTNAASSVASTGSGFWQNKAGVAATFVIVSLLIVGAFAFGLISWLRRRNIRRQNRLHAELFEKFSARSPDGGSPSPSINASPMDSSSRREVRYDNAPPSHSYGIALPQIQHSTSSIHDLDPYSKAPLRYSPPSHSIAATGPSPPGAFREPNSRASYQPSIDSFYGGPASNKF